MKGPIPATMEHTQPEQDKKPFRIAYIGRSFLDYRVPVFEALNRMTGGALHVVYGREVTPERVQRKISEVLGRQAVGLEGERRIGPKVISGFANRTIRVAWQPGALAALKRIQPDVLVGDGFFQWTAFAYVYRILHRIPLVICYERTFHTEKNAQWYRRVYRRVILNFVDAMSCSGKLSKEYALALGMDGKRITTGHMVADTENLTKQAAAIGERERKEMRERWGTPRVAFLTVGQLIKRKGFYQLLEGWGKYPGAGGGKSALIIVGSGPEQAALARRAKDLKLKSVFFAGAVDYDDMAKYYASADVFIMPTLEDNWSLVVPEAMACGLPVLCSVYNGCWPELIQEGRNGWIFDPLRPNSVVQALTKALDNAARLKQMGVESQNVVADHTPERAASAIWVACKKALKSRKPL